MPPEPPSSRDFCRRQPRLLDVVCPACGQENPDGRPLLPRVRLLDRRGDPAAQGRAADRHRHLRRPGRVHGPGRAARPRGGPRGARAVPRPRPPRDRVVRRRRREVHRRRGDGSLRSALAHGDDAERAVRAALVVRDIVGELAGGDLQIRIAVNTGEAVVSLGARPALGESMVAGDVVNTAARLQAAAPVERGRRRRGDLPDDARRDRVRGRRPGRREGQGAPGRGLARGARDHRGGRAADRRACRSSAARSRSRSCSALWERVVRRAAAAPRLGLRAGRRRQDDARRRVRPGTPPSTAPASCTGRSLPYRESGTYGALATQVMKLCGVYESDPARRGRREAALERTSALLAGTDADPDVVSGHLGVIVGVDAGGEASDREALFYSVARVPRGGRPRAADDPRLRGRPLGRREPARPHRALATGVRGLPLLFVDARAARSCSTCGRLGRRARRLHGADARRRSTSSTPASSTVRRLGSGDQRGRGDPARRGQPALHRAARGEHRRDRGRGSSRRTCAGSSPRGSTRCRTRSARCCSMPRSSARCSGSTRSGTDAERAASSRSCSTQLERRDLDPPRDRRRSSRGSSSSRSRTC